MYLTGILGGLNNRGVTGCWHANGVLAQPPESRQGPKQGVQEVRRRSTQGQPHTGSLAWRARVHPSCPTASTRHSAGPTTARACATCWNTGTEGLGQEVHRTKADSGSGLRPTSPTLNLACAQSTETLGRQSSHTPGPKPHRPTGCQARNGVCYTSSEGGRWVQSERPEWRTSGQQGLHLSRPPGWAWRMQAGYRQTR